MHPIAEMFMSKIQEARFNWTFVIYDKTTLRQSHDKGTSSLETLSALQCGAVITWSVFSQIITKATYSSPASASYGWLLRIQTLIYILTQPLQWYIQYTVILNHFITTTACTGFCNGNLQVTSGFKLRRACNAHIWYFLVVNLNNLLNKLFSCDLRRHEHSMWHHLKHTWFTKTRTINVLFSVQRFQLSIAPVQDTHSLAPNDRCPLSRRSVDLRHHFGWWPFLPAIWLPPRGHSCHCQTVNLAKIPQRNHSWISLKNQNSLALFK